MLFCGVAGWSLPKAHAAHFPAEGSHLERYAVRLGAVEINSSFYRPHRFQSYVRWADSVPDTFRFAVKMPKSITHESRLRDAQAPLEAFLGEVAGLGAKLGPLLVQLPPSLSFDEAIAAPFFSLLRARFQGLAVCEPRHASWFQADAQQLLGEFEVARVAADPARVPLAARPGGWNGLAYFRWHGSPTIYRSAYAPETLAQWAAGVRQKLRQNVPTWCIFDNTAEGAATLNALELGALLRSQAAEWGENNPRD